MRLRVKHASVRTRSGYREVVRSLGIVIHDEKQALILLRQLLEINFLVEVYGCVTR